MAYPALNVVVVQLGIDQDIATHLAAPDSLLDFGVKFAHVAHFGTNPFAFAFLLASIWSRIFFASILITE